MENTTIQALIDLFPKLIKKNEQLKIICHEQNIDIFEETDQIISSDINQNLVAMASGLSKSGIIPFVCSSPYDFMNQYNEIREMISFSKQNIKLIAIDNIGFDKTTTGPLEQCFEDIGLFNMLPNIEIYNPLDYFEASAILKSVTKSKNPCYIRLHTRSTPLFFDKKHKFKNHSPIILRTGQDATIITSGPITFECLIAAENLQHRDNLSIQVIHFPQLKPINNNVINVAAIQTNKIITVEEHSIHGGLGDLISQELCINHPTKHLRLGLRDTYSLCGNKIDVLENMGLDSEGIYLQISDFLK